MLYIQNLRRKVCLLNYIDAKIQCCRNYLLLFPIMVFLAEIKKLAKAPGNNDTVRILAKQLVGIRKQKTRSYAASSKVRFSSILMHYYIYINTHRDQDKKYTQRSRLPGDDSENGRYYISYKKKFYGLQDDTKLFGKFSQFLGLGGIFKNLSNIFNFLEQSNTSIERS